VEGRGFAEGNEKATFPGGLSSKLHLIPAKIEARSLLGKEGCQPFSGILFLSRRDREAEDRNFLASSALFVCDFWREITISFL
jgi:hypothetical protein